MKILCTTLCCLILIYFETNAQQIKKKTEYNNDLEEVFFVDKNSDMLDGLYYVLQKNQNDTLITGQYTNGLRTGNWSVFDKKTGNKKLVFNFTNDTLLFIQPDLFPDSFLVRIDNDFKYKEVDRPLVFIGYDGELKNLLAQKMDVPKEVYTQAKTGSSIVCYVVDENGYIAGSKVIATFNPVIDQNINSIVNSFNGRLLPAIVDGQPIKSMFYIKSNFGVDASFATSDVAKSPYIFEMNFSFVTTKVEAKKKKSLGFETKVVRMGEM